MGSSRRSIIMDPSSRHGSSVQNQNGDESRQKGLETRKKKNLIGMINVSDRNDKKSFILGGGKVPVAFRMQALCEEFKEHGW